jgi:hypothetical protein
MTQRDDDRDHDELDRRAILARRARLLSMALAGVALAAVAPARNPVCAQGTDHTQRGANDASAQADAADPLEALESMPEESVDASMTVAPRPQVCLSAVPCLSNDPPRGSGCGCRRDPSDGPSS